MYFNSFIRKLQKGIDELEFSMLNILVLICKVGWSHIAFEKMMWRIVGGICSMFEKLKCLRMRTTK